MTDRIELAEHRTEHDDLREPLLVRIAGMKKHAGAEHIHVGDVLALRREPHNPHDPNATMIVAPGGQKAGYVPRQYSAMIAGLVDSGVQLEATAIRQLGVPADVGRWVVRILRRS